VNGEPRQNVRSEEEFAAAPRLAGGAGLLRGLPGLRNAFLAPPAHPRGQLPESVQLVRVRDVRVRQGVLRDFGQTSRGAGEVRVVEEGTAEQCEPGGKPARVFREGESVVEAGGPGLFGERGTDPRLKRNAGFRGPGGEGVEVGGRVAGGDRAAVEAGEPQSGAAVELAQQLDGHAGLAGAVGGAVHKAGIAGVSRTGRHEEARRGRRYRFPGLLLRAPSRRKHRGGIGCEEEELEPAGG